MNDFKNKGCDWSELEGKPEEAPETETVYMELKSDTEAQEKQEKQEPAYSVSQIETGSFSDESEIDPDETVKKIENRKKRTALQAVYDYLEVFCYALATMMVLFLFVFRLVTVDGDSMRATLTNGDKLIISNLFYTPETGDIVVINPENHGDADEPIIKRVIATEGQKVRIDYENWTVYVDGKKLDEPYIVEMMNIEKQRWGSDTPMDGTNVPKYKNEFTVGANKVFVMGDNRNNSKDSRSREYGEMGVNRILGKVIFRLTPDFGAVD